MRCRLGAGQPDDNRVAESYRGLMSLSAGFALPSRLKSAAAGARTFLRAAVDIALPPLCAACRQPVDGKWHCP